ncbi:MAG: hypothetical protein ABSG57_10625 [Candidatus Bathyarchaeia archaeon]
MRQLNSQERVILAILLLALFAFLLPWAGLTRADESSSEAEAVAFNFLQHVAVANFSNYNVNVTSIQWTAYAYYPSWDIGFQLSRGNYTELMDVSVSNGVISWFCAPSPHTVIGADGSPTQVSGTNMTVQSNDTLRLTRDILSSYESCVNRSYCTLLTTLTDQALSKGSLTLNAGNSTITLSQFACPTYKSSEFDYSAATNSTYSLWMKFNPDGHLEEFGDSIGELNLSSLNVKNVNVSKEQAINIAMPYALNYSKTYGRTVESANATLSYVPGGPMFDAYGNGTRDPYSLYPAWDVDILFTKLPAGKQDYGVFGFQVRVWADNGQVAAADAAAKEGSSSSSSSSPSSSPTQTSSIDYLPVLLGAAAAASFIAMSFVVYRKNGRRRREGLE